MSETGSIVGGETSVVGVGAGSGDSAGAWVAGGIGGGTERCVVYAAEDSHLWNGTEVNEAVLHRLIREMERETTVPQRWLVRLVDGRYYEGVPHRNPGQRASNLSFKLQPTSARGAEFNIGRQAISLSLGQVHFMQHPRYGAFYVQGVSWGDDPSLVLRAIAEWQEAERLAVVQREQDALRKRIDSLEATQGQGLVGTEGRTSLIGDEDEAVPPASTGTIDATAVPVPIDLAGQQQADMRAWGEFRQTSLLWWINRSLHLFGWAICLEANADGAIERVYPKRVSYRGFGRETEERHFRNLTGYLQGLWGGLVGEVRDGDPPKPVVVQSPPSVQETPLLPDPQPSGEADPSPSSAPSGASAAPRGTPPIGILLPPFR